MSDLSEKIQLAKAKLNQLLDESGGAQKAIVTFSGGKDSIVLVDLIKERKADFDLVWANTQAMFPHMEEFVREYQKQGFTLVEVQSDQPGRLNAVGLPSSVVPISFVHYRQVKITDWISCCHDLRSLPILKYAINLGHKFMINGQRKEDNFITQHHEEVRPLNYEASRVTLVSPLWDWTTDEIMEYIREHGLSLPNQYPEVLDSLECWSCTHNPTKPKINYMRREYPELLHKLKPLLLYVYTAANDELNSQLDAVAYAGESR